MKNYSIHTLLIIVFFSLISAHAIGQHRVSIATGSGASVLAFDSRPSTISNWNTEGQISPGWMGFAELHAQSQVAKIKFGGFIGYKMMGYRLSGSESREDALSWTQRTTNQRFRNHCLYAGINFVPYSFKVKNKHKFDTYIQYQLGSVVNQEHIINESVESRYLHNRETYMSRRSADGDLIDRVAIFMAGGLGVRYNNVKSAYGYSIFTDVNYYHEFTEIDRWRQTSYGHFFQFRFGIALDIYAFKSKASSKS